MKSLYTLLYCSLAMLITSFVRGQDIALLEQFNGRYDFTFVGNTLNTMENNSIAGQPAPPCIILTGSSATLTLDPQDEIVRAYLYWAGSGTGDFTVKLNGQDIVPDRTFSAISPMYVKENFSAVADVTELVQLAGNSVYTFSDLDLSGVIADYCWHGGNFGGWAMIVVYRNDTLPLNQLNVYEGMQRVPTAVTISLNSLNVIDNNGAKIGFLAWEGDKNIAEGEELRINDSLVSNVQNPDDNAFNGTNSITGSNELFNMDLDIYDFSGYINIGASSAVIELKSDRDFVMVNAIVTKLNSRLPDLTISIDNVTQQCDSRTFIVEYTLYNTNSTEVVPPNTTSSVFINDIFLQSFTTTASIPIGGSISGQLTLQIPPEVPETFELTLIADSNAAGVGTLTEINEDNNTAAIPLSLWFSPDVMPVPSLRNCDEGFGESTFDLSIQDDLINAGSSTPAEYFRSFEDARLGTNAISNKHAFIAGQSPMAIFYRVTNEYCSAVGAFNLVVNKCPPTLYNLVDPHPDGFYDHLTTEGLRDIFPHYYLSIYNRWGKLVWTGNNNTPEWTGTSNEGNNIGGDELPSGTYYYVLELNEPDYTNPLTGFIHLRR